MIQVFSRLVALSVVLSVARMQMWPKERWAVDLGPAVARSLILTDEEAGVQEAL